MRLVDVRPSSSIDNAADVASFDAERIGNRLMGFPGLGSSANCFHNLFGQSCGVMLLAFLATMIAHVSIVFSRQPPSQINEAIISGVAVSMEAFHPVGAWANKGEQYKAMNLNTSGCARIGPQANNLAAVSVVCPLRQLTPIVDLAPFVVPARPYAPVVADTISIEARNVFVCSHASILSHKDRRAIVA